MKKTYIIQQPVVNFDLRTEMFDGKKYLVAPVVLLTEGVHNGLFYPAAELEKFPMSWNGRPVSIYHPEKNGEPICCNDPDILQSQGVGFLFNVIYDKSGRKLKGEVWIDENKARGVSPEALSEIRKKSGKPEVSTGLYVEADGQPGIWNSEEYEQTVINYRPDHLALLPGVKGACSWEDGCGVRANRQEENNNTAIQSTADSGGKEDLDTDEAKEFAAQLMENKERKPNFFRRLASYLGVDFVLGGMVPHDELVEWANNSDIFKEMKSKEVKEMNKEKLVQALIDNSKSQFTADDKEWLMAQEDAVLKKIEGTCCPPEEPQPVKVVNVEVKPAAPATLEEFVASAPKEVATVIINAMNESKKRKERLVDFVVANSDIPKERVEKKELEDLEMLAETISKLTKKSTPDFSLNSGIYTVEKSETGVPDTEPLVVPVINWKE